MAKEIITAGSQLLLNDVALEGLLSTPEMSQGSPEKLEVEIVAVLDRNI